MALRKLGPPSRSTTDSPRRAVGRGPLRLHGPGPDGRYHPQARCELCPLRSLGSYVPDSGPEGAWLALVGMAPAKVEVEKGEPFVGPSGDLLNLALGMAGIDRKHLRIVNRVGCRPVGDDLEARIRAEDLDPGLRRELEERERAVGKKKPASSYAIGEVAAWLCRGRLLGSIEGARVILTLGGFALRGFAPEVGSLLAIRGCVIDLKEVVA